MLSRKTRQQVVELLETVDAGLVRFSSATEKAAMLEDCIAAFSAAQDICHEALSTARLAFYRETLDTLSAALEQLPVAGDSADIASLCHSLLGWLLDALREEPVKKEIVFLPYKASMWDSLESIWQAAVNDAEHCSAYVIPIPYADLTPEHTAKEWHVEKELFPDYVPVIDFRSVDLEKLHPDVIFIHNPYDWANHVTSVDARYYSEQLKKYTDKLVYIPYFTAPYRVTPALCQVPGVVQADYVIVESKAVKTQYEWHYPAPKPPTDKFLSLGSPKYDKVQNGTKKAYPLPPAWRQRALGKKIILYNTSLNAVLQIGALANTKLRAVFDFFRHRKDVVIWWRPHPLMKATLDSMRPQMAAEYRRLEKEYCEGDWGIYDDTSDVTRAVIWADGYYGDASSVENLFQKLNKPIMRENFFCRADQKWQPRWFTYMSVDKRTAWFLSEISGTCPGLFQMDLDTDEVTFYGQLLPEDEAQGLSHGLTHNVLAKIQNKIVMAPCFSTLGFIEYDCANQTFTEHDSPQELWCLAAQKEEAAAFAQAIVYQQSVFFIGNYQGIIVEYEGKEGRYQYHTTWASRLQPDFPLTDLHFRPYSACLRGNVIYLPIENKAVILALRLDTMEAELIRLPFPARVSYIIHDGHDFLLLSVLEQTIIRWNQETGAFRRIELSIGRQGEETFRGCMPWGERIGIFPAAGYLPPVCVRENHVEIWQELQHVWEKAGAMPEASVNFAMTAPDEGRGFAFHTMSRILTEFDLRTGEIKAHAQQVRPFSPTLAKVKGLDEGEIFSLEDFVAIKTPAQAPSKPIELAGDKIYRAVVQGSGYDNV